MKVVDTTLLVGHARGEQAVATYLSEHANQTLLVSTISLQELAVGEVLARGESRAAIIGYLGSFDVRAFTDAHAYEAAGIEAELRGSGEYDPSLARDVLIGGVARSLSVPVVTRNTDHFERFEGVHVETY